METDAPQTNGPPSGAGSAPAGQPPSTSAAVEPASSAPAAADVAATGGASSVPAAATSAGDAAEGDAAPSRGTVRSQQPGGSNAPPRKRTKRGKKGRALPPDPPPVNDDDYVKVVPLPDRVLEAIGPQPVKLSSTSSAKGMKLGKEGLSVTSWKGYRTTRATHGAHEGAYYYEVTVKRLGATGHARVGWITKQGEIEAPVGYDTYGFSYRDLEGCKVHKGLREPFGAPYREGDVVGCLLRMPPGGARRERGLEDIVKWRGNYYSVEENKEDSAAPPPPLAGSGIGFCLNGAWQGWAYADIPEGTYYPALSIYTLPEQNEGAELAVNFGPDFAHKPPSDLKTPDDSPLTLEPISALSNKLPTCTPASRPSAAGPAEASPAGVSRPNPKP